MPSDGINTEESYSIHLK